MWTFNGRGVVQENLGSYQENIWYARDSIAKGIKRAQASESKKGWVGLDLIVGIAINAAIGDHHFFMNAFLEFWLLQ